MKYKDNKYPIVTMGITAAEIPNKLAVYFEVGNCIQDCPACHSEHLRGITEDFMLLDDIKRYASVHINLGANAIVIMGGTTNIGMTTTKLRTLINELENIAPVCLYSGSDDAESDKELALETDLTWLKTGSYKEELGGLLNAATNQRFYKKGIKCVSYLGRVKTEVYLQDITNIFRNDGVENA